MTTTNEISKILIVDDNQFYLSVLKAILKDVKASVYMANSGKEALNLINENCFALAILDIQMPEMNGFELAVHIKNLHDRDLLPIIFLTADSSDEIYMFKGYDNGAIDYLTKPVNKTIFISKVNIFLELDQQKRKLIASKESLLKSKLELEQKQEQMKLQNIALQKAQEESEESRNKYIRLYDFAPTGFFTINRAGKINEINIKGARLLEIEPIDSINFDFSKRIASESLIDFENFLTSVFKGETQSGCELKLKSNNKKTIYVSIEGAIIDEKQTCLLSMTDITERKVTQIALKESEELYHSLLRTSPDGIIVTDLNGRITEASDISIHLLGIEDRKKIEGLHFIQFVPKSSLRALIKIIQTTIREGMVQNVEIKLKRIDNTEFISEISSSQIRGNNGEVNAFMSVIRDISERKLFEKQIRHSERMTGIGELATGMAHEINQPLNTISLIVDNIIYSIENQTITESYLKTKINKVFDNITRIKKIIDHVRTFSRDQDDFVQADFEINASIQNSISMISEQFSHKEIDLSFHPDKSIPILTGNGYRFEQVILNMLINAKDAIEEKKKRNGGKFKKKIEISTTLKDKLIIVEIKDNGTGIAPEDIDKVLLPFFTTKAPGKGTGLGLSISYGIIKELGGEIGIQSDQKSGTTISIKIPVQDSINKKYTFSHVQ
jgi:PAS domain S-box-containing protein